MSPNVLKYVKLLLKPADYSKGPTLMEELNHFILS